MCPEHTTMETIILQMLLEKTGFVDGQQIRLLNKDILNSLLEGDVHATASSFLFPDRQLLVFLCAKTESSWQAHDNKLQDMIRKRFGIKVLSITFRRETEKEAERIADEIISEAGLSSHEVLGDHPQFFVWDKRDLFCKDCGRGIGRFASKSSGRCQSCNLLRRMKKEKAQQRRVST